MKKLICQKSFGQAKLYAKLLPDKDIFMPEFFQAKKSMCYFSGQRNLYARIFPENETYMSDEMWMKKLISELFQIKELISLLFL